MEHDPGKEVDQAVSLIFKNAVFRRVVAKINKQQQENLGLSLELSRFTELEAAVKEANGELLRNDIIGDRVHIPAETVIGFTSDNHNSLSYHTLGASEIGWYVGMAVMREQFLPDLEGKWPLVYSSIRLDRDYAEIIMPLPSEDIVVPTLFETMEFIN